MKNQRPSIDGFVPRRTGSQLGEFHDPKARMQNRPTAFDRTLRSDDQAAEPVGQVRSQKGIGRSDIDDSLREIDSSDGSAKKLSRRQRRRLEKQGKPRSKARRIIKWILLLMLLAAIGIGGYVGYKTLAATGQIFKGNIFDLVQNQPLKQDTNGRTNILILGTSEDDPGHQAGNLTDSMMILSLDQNKKNAYMISIPRDLYVQYGIACDAGYNGRINVYYGCVTDGTTVDAQRAALTKTATFIGGIFGLDIQYGVNVNYTVMRDVVNAIGGSINVTIQSRDPRGQMDSNFDWKCGATYAKRIQSCPPNGHFIDYPNGPVTLDAEHALYLAQARGDIAPTYGFEQSNFDREKNQQKIIKAIRDKAMNVGVLTDFNKVSNILTSLGNNLRTTFEVSEIKTLYSLAQNIKDSDINSISLIDGTTPIMTTGNVDGQSVVRPAAGVYKYSALQTYIKQQLSNDPVTHENASIVVLNGSGVSGVAQGQADKLKAGGLVIGAVDTAPKGTYDAVDIYQIDTSKSATLEKLKQIYQSAVIKTTKPPVAVDSTTAFVIVIGSAGQ
jgi:anionic cell wall polymer biosynthesis LytR-Cps2A-Psr (LCP) family protein